MKYLKYICVFTFSLLLLGILSSNHASALDTTYFDTSDADNQTINLVVGQTQFVRQTGVRLKAYFNTNSGQITVYKFNFCPAQAGNPDAVQNADYYDNHAIPANLNVTSFVVGGTTYYGQYKGTGGACDSSIVKNLANLPQDPNTGLYYAAIDVDFMDSGTGYAGILNYFRVAITGGSGFAIAQEGGSTGYEVTMQQVGGAQSNTAFSIPFGSDCSINAQTSKNLYYYDIDNDGGAGAQLNGKITMALYDRTAARWWNDSTGKWQVAFVSWTPPTNDNARSATSFNALPDHKYTWRIYNVYRNNTIQFSTPFNGIYALANCPAPKLDPNVTATPSPTAAVGAPITFTFDRTVTGYRNPRDVKYNIDYSYDSAAADGSPYVALPSNANITSSNIYSPRNMILHISGNVTNLPFVPNLIFTSAALAGHNRVCVKITITDRDDMILVKPSDYACVSIAVPPPPPPPPPTPPILNLTGTTYEKSLGSVVNITGTVDCKDYRGNVIWKTTNGASLTDGSGTVNCASGGVINITPFNINGGDALNAKLPGSYTLTPDITTPVDGVAGTGATVTISEVPFARFFGQDVLVCDTGDNNRFMFDTANGKKGSFSSLATIFKSLGGNQFNGLHTQDPADVTRDKLQATWSSLTSGGTCSNPTITPTGSPDTSGPNITAAGKKYYTSSNASIGGGAVTGQITIIDSGTVTINGDITSSIPTGSLNTTTAPVLLIKAQNIVIAPSVSRVDAVLVATNNIYTCSSNTTQAARASWDTACRGTLIINGALVAPTIHLQRNGGTRLLSNTTITPPSSNAYSLANDVPAETINFPAYLNFMPLNLEDGAQKTLDSYYNIPPRL